MWLLNRLFISFDLFFFVLCPFQYYGDFFVEFSSDYLEAVLEDDYLCVERILMAS